MSLKGNTTDFPLDVLLRFLADQKKTGELVLHGAEGEGALGLADGRVVTAVYGDEPPIPALGAVFDLSQADFEFTPWNEAPAANLEGELQDNLRKADEHKKWLAAVREVIPHDRLRFRLAERAAEQGAVTFTSDRWRVVLAVNGQRDVNDLATHLQIDRNAALNVLAGLVRDGVIETIEPPASAEAPQSWSAPVSPAPEPAPQFVEPPPQFVEPAQVMEPPPPAPREDWSAALLRATPAAPEPAPPAPEPAPPAPAPEPPAAAPAPTFSTPAPVAPQPMPAPPEPPAPVADQWATNPEPAPQWTTNPEPAPEWTAPSATPTPTNLPQAADAWSGQAAPASDWSAAPPAPTPAEPAAPAQDWAPATPPAPAPPAQEWAPPAPVEPEPVRTEAKPESAPLDDRLATLFGSVPAETPSSSTDQWSAPAPTDHWSTPAPAAGEWTAPAAPETPAEDPRLAAMRLPPPIQTAPPAAPAMPPNEWAPPPASETPAPAKKRGLFGLGRREEPAPARGSGAAVAEPGAGSRIGQLAAFSNALLNEYNSGKYGKARVDDRMPSLLMRVDEQADPIDRPLPVVDDRLDVQAMERVTLSEVQAVPYLAFLVTTIYGDAEKAFGRDKAKKGYKAAHVQLFGGDASALAGPDLAGKLPKV